ncbi:MAG: SCO family protein [Gammaproteobacteria bacterium]|nr:SCO family protein [Gammaproteobacteria bacterium]MDH5653235.1 SCO family protein [Gammaproteobacteria bacterium]
MSDVEQIRKQNQRTILMLLGAFILPLVLAWFVYLNTSGVHVTNNGGHLITPARPLQSLALTAEDGKPFGFSELKGKWHLVYIGNGACTEKCHAMLSKMHQVRMAQGKDMSRLDLLFITNNKAEQNNSAKLAGQYARLSVLYIEPGNAQQFTKLFSGAGNGGAKDNIYVIDPLGNLMLQYTDAIALIGIIKDLTRLLKNSQIG